MPPARRFNYVTGPPARHRSEGRGDARYHAGMPRPHPTLLLVGSLAVLVAACDRAEAVGDIPATVETPWWVLIVVAIALLGLIVAFTWRGNREKVVGRTSPNAATWKDHARAGYADARWLYDAMEEDLALWRANTQFSQTEDDGISVGTSRAETWQELAARINRTRDHLHVLEATAPDVGTAEVARTTLTTLTAVRTALDARAESRYAYRQVETAPLDPATSDARPALIEARDHEIRASTNLNRARSEYATALTALSNVL